MFELTVISGKGGTGKSSVTRALVECAGEAVITDCDVDAANLHLVLDHREEMREPFISGYDFKIDLERCTSCALCLSQCVFGAIHDYTINPYRCEGCGVCHYFCPGEAINKSDKECGEFIRATSAYGPFLFAKLHPGEENSGKLVAKIRETSRETARELGARYIINDGPPGIGCPVIASITGANGILIVSEPTVSGYEDYLRASALVKHFRIPLFVCVNKADINPSIVEKIRQSTLDVEGVQFVGIVDYDLSFNQAQKERTSVMKIGSEKLQKQIRSIWDTIVRSVN